MAGNPSTLGVAHRLLLLLGGLRLGRARQMTTIQIQKVASDLAERVVGESADEFLGQTGDSEFRFKSEVQNCLSPDQFAQARISPFRPALQTRAVQISQPARFNDANRDQLQRRQCFRARCGCFTWKVVAEVKSQDGKENVLTCILTFQKCAWRTPSISSFLLENC